MLLSTKGKTVNFQGRNLADTSAVKWSRIISPGIRYTDLRCPPMWYPEKDSTLFASFPIIGNFSLNKDKQQTTPNWGILYQKKKKKKDKHSSTVSNPCKTQTNKQINKPEQLPQIGGNEGHMTTKYNVVNELDPESERVKEQK